MILTPAYVALVKDLSGKTDESVVEIYVHTSVKLTEVIFRQRPATRLLQVKSESTYKDR